MTVNDLLNAVRERQALASNYALGRFLDVRETTIWRWTSGRNTPDDETAARLANLAGLDPDVVVAAMQAARAKTDAERQRWERIAERLEKSAALGAAAAAVVLGMLAPTPPALAYSGGATADPLKIMLTGRRRRLLAALALLIIRSRAA